MIESYKLLHINYIRSGRLERNGKLTKRPNQKTFQYMYTCSKKDKVDISVSYKISRLSESWLFHLNSTFPVNCSEISASRNKYRTNYTNTDTGTICPLQSGESREREEARGTNFQEETNVWFCHFSDKLERENQTLFNCCHDKINQQHNEDFLLL